VIPLITALTNARKAAGLRQQDVAAAIGLAASSGPSMVCQWERGRSAPRVGHTCAYAALLGRRVVAVRDGQLVGELGALMPRLRDLLDDAGLSVRQVADGLFVTPASITSIIRLAGPGTHLPTAISVLGAIRCTLELGEVSCD
jgi:transcriptional regulator with XRE-family HTH domain